MAFPFKAVIFDMDGVIVDTEAFYQEDLKRFVEHHGLSVSEEELTSTVGLSEKAFCRVLADWFERAGYGAIGPSGAGAHFDAWCEQTVCDYRELLNPDVPETIAELKRRGARVALASSTSLAGIREALGAVGLLDAFEVIVSGEQFHESKPEPEIYLHTLDLLGLEADSCCCVEDSVPGITAGKRAGLTVFAKREERFGFSQDEADCILDKVSDILTAVDALRG